MNSPLNLDQFAPLFGAPKAQQYAYSADPDSVFVLLSWPTETIARALLGPITAAAQDGELHYFVCFVTDASGGQIAVKRFQKRWDNLNSIWPHLDSLLRCDPAMSLRPLNQRLMADQDAFSRYCTVDYWLKTSRRGDSLHSVVRQFAARLSMEKWGTDYPLKPDLGVASETQAKEVFAASLGKKIDLWLEAVNTDLRDTLRQRPALRIQTCNALLMAASVHGPLARRNVIQALRTEPLGVLELMASENSVEGQRLRDAVIAGASFPDRLNAFGIPQRPHRLLLRHDQLPLNGPAWLSIARHFSSTRIEAHDQCKKYFEAVRTFAALGCEDASLVVELIDWCVATGGKNIEQRFRYLERQFCKLQSVLAQKTASVPTAEQLLSWLLPLKIDGTGDSQRHPNPLFENYPPVPNVLNLPSHWEWRALNDWAKVTEHGAAQGNCLSDIACVIHYLGEGAAFYGLYVHGKAKATVAIQASEINGDMVLHAMELECRDRQFIADAYWGAVLWEIDSMCVAQVAGTLSPCELASQVRDRCLHARQNPVPRIEEFVEALVAAFRAPEYASHWVPRATFHSVESIFWERCESTEAQSYVDDDE